MELDPPLTPQWGTHRQSPKAHLRSLFYVAPFSRISKSSALFGVLTSKKLRLRCAGVPSEPTWSPVPSTPTPPKELGSWGSKMTKLVLCCIKYEAPGPPNGWQITFQSSHWEVIQTIRQPLERGRNPRSRLKPAGLKQSLAWTGCFGGSVEGGTQ